MPLDSATQRWLAAAPAFNAAVPLAVMRSATDAGLIAGQQPVAGKIRDWQALSIEAEDGWPVAVRMYFPAGAKDGEAHPALVYAHGGGWCLGGLDAWSTPCQQLADATGSVVFSVGYRLAPEHPFPVPLSDFYAALCAISDRADSLGIDPQRIAVGGDSAGGNLAAAACLLARDRQGPLIARQLLLYPALDTAMQSASWQQFGEGFGLTRSVMEYCWERYLPDAREQPNPLASPSAAASLHGLPDTLLLSCECDPLRDEAEAYARRLARDGNNVRLERLAGTVHGAMHMTAVTPAAWGVFEQCAALWDRPAT
ncbi:alpha/beta hydrolase [Erwinia sp. S38]|uniref:alpha/beta hydrolase n=1 Tax=Erwinia sp. S38 TaxID=2769338 RepID=UPI00190E13F7|nr:alpha/beta hydrolase [Erwinia sp. S38]MBK0002957.1 alpha/beta hydrolase [Erwinia sp. S38]